MEAVKRISELRLRTFDKLKMMFTCEVCKSDQHVSYINGFFRCNTCNKLWTMEQKEKIWKIN